MAVEARHMDLLTANREITNYPMESNFSNPYNLLQIGCGSFPLSGTAAALLPMYSSGITDSLPPRTPLKSDSGITCSNINAISRKRTRECFNGVFVPYSVAQRSDQSCSSPSSSSLLSFLGEDVFLQIQQQNLDMDRLIVQQMEKVRWEIEEQRKNQARRILEAIEGRVVKRLRTKEEEIEKIVRMNYALEERIRSLCVENQIWRDLALSNEAAANALRSNLEQVLDQTAAAMVDGAAAENVYPLMEDAQSFCGSSGGDKEVEGGRTEENSAVSDRMRCRKCGKGEARVLLLPCRHLCLCTVCGASIHTCPICKCIKTASVNVNISQTEKRNM